MAKPGGPVCNLACDYCYYLDKERLFPPGAPRRMPDELLESFIAQRFALAPAGPVLFEWHGGERTALGLDYFRRIALLERRHVRPDQQVQNGLQTNGLLLDDAWAGFFADEGFSVGLSLDGPRELHDLHRVDRGGRPTHREVVRAFELLQRHRVHCDVLCVLHSANAAAPLPVYRYFKELGVRWLQFLPLVERHPSGQGVSERTASPEAVGDFFCAVFDDWARNDVGRIAIQLFDEAMRPAAGLPHSLCLFRESCGDVLVLEHEGSLFACDHYVDPEHLVGSLREQPLAELARSPALAAFGRAKRETLPSRCRDCDVLAHCNGGCPKDRLGDEPSYLCPAYRRFFRHSRPTMERLAALWRSGLPLATIHGELRDADRRATHAAGRNDPCPCGSGRKFKRCCLPAR